MNTTPNSRDMLLQTSPIDEIQRWKEQQEQAGRAHSMHMFGNTVESIAHFVNHALSILTLDTIHCEMRLRRTAPEAREEISHSFEEMRDEIKMIEAGVKAMLSFSNLVCAKYPKQKEGSII